ncbi:MAG: tRNA (adenosine(37)-N6)-dimethylallyltransferase MiaA [Clostridia bacterium]|nr:tRNA (adenosine(37)-N6)-dimethylallyltransferase MiaA [Clostridia bacterium]
MKPKILAVVGPTASGKTALSIALAKALDGEILCCDSMQIYDGMDIGTAKPTPEEQDGVPHHLFGFADPAKEFNCADYATIAKNKVREIAARGKLPIFCGGTGLYLDAVLRSGDFSPCPADEACRQALKERLATEGAEALHRELAACDPVSAAAIHPNNTVRVMRALEIYQLSGIPKSEWDRRSQAYEPEFDLIAIGLHYNDRALLENRIDRRVDIMLAEGLEGEVRRLLDAGKLTAGGGAKAIGYKEMLDYVAGVETLADATEKIKLATRQYSKRQMTWFRSHGNVRWIHADDADGRMRPFAEIYREALAYINEKL